MLRKVALFRQTNEICAHSRLQGGILQDGIVDITDEGSTVANRTILGVSVGCKCN